MMDYEWGNPSTIMMFSADLYPETHFQHPTPLPTFLDSTTALTLEPASYMLLPKTEDPLPQGYGYKPELGLNLGGRTYFPAPEGDLVNRFYLRSRLLEPGSVNFPRCQVEGCTADLTHAKHYHRRHKVCEFHSKAATVLAAGLTQRFCQQCSRFHVLTEFDNGKRSCRRRLADHNRRRRKSNQDNNIKSHNTEKKNNNNHNHNSCIPKSSPETLTRFPPPQMPESGLLSSLPTISLNRSYNSGGASSSSTNSMFY